MWKKITSPPELSWLDVSEDGKVRRHDTGAPYPIHPDPAGYPEITVLGERIVNPTTATKYHTKVYKVHRLVAAQFIGPIPEGYEVHHIDEDKTNPYYKNLKICTPLEHRREHATTSAPIPSSPAHHGDTVLTEDQVHAICKMLVDGKSFPQIREALHLYGITDDCIGKIAQGKRWKKIRCLYDIPINTRETMNHYSDRALVIGIMKSRGYTIPDIGRMLGEVVGHKGDKSYDRLAKCALRYAQWLQNGKWGLIRKSYGDELINKLKDTLIN